jgi:glutamate carboxypeptidase
MTDTIVSYLESQLEAYLAELAELSGMDSYSYDRDDVNHVVDWLESRLLKLGFVVQRHPQEQTGDNLLTTRVGSGGGRVMLLGHSDTVFPRGTAAERPMTIDEDIIRGPGVCDMKSGLLTGIYAVEALDAIGFHKFGQISFLIVSDEEIDERHSIPLIRKACFGNDAVLTLESARANGDIVTARKGVRSFTAEAFGKAAHSGVEPEKGASAIVALARRVVDLDLLTDYSTGVTVNVGVISGGRLRNVVPDYAIIKFEARAYDYEKLDTVTQTILALFEESTVPGVSFKISYEDVHPPMPRTAAIEALEVLTQHLAIELGFEVKGASTGGAADAAFAADEGIAVLDGLGPIGGLDHSPDEYILKNSIVPRTALLARLMMAIGRVGK